MNESTRRHLQNSRTYLIHLVCAVALLCGCSSGDKPYTMDESGEATGTAERPVSADQWKIAFNSDRDGNYEVYLINPDGSDPLNLTTNEATDWVYFAGEQIVFASDRNGEYRQGDYDLYTTDTRGVVTEKLTRFPVYDSYVSASPDGKRFVVCSRTDGDSEIYIIDNEGNQETQLTDNQFEVFK